MDSSIYKVYERSSNPHIPDWRMQISMDHRFRGYPSGQMESPRIRHPHPTKEIRLPEPLPAEKPRRRTWSPPGYPPAPLPPAPPARPDRSSWSNEQYPYCQWHACPSSPKKHDLSEAEMDAILKKHFELSKRRPIPPVEDTRKRKMMEKSLKEELKLDLAGAIRDDNQQRDKDSATNRSTKSSVNGKQPAPFPSPIKSPSKENRGEKAKSVEDNSSQKQNGGASWRAPEIGPLDRSPPHAFPAFGTPGGGSPNFDKHGNRIAIIPGPSTVMRDVEEERKKEAAARMYSKELEQAILIRDLMRIKEKQTQRSGPTETFVDKMQNAHTGKPRRHPDTGRLADQHLSSTDVTNLCNISPRHYDSYAQLQKAPLNYSTQLERQAEDRKLRAVLETHRDRTEAQQHFAAFDRTFGSSLPDTLRKQNLTRLLYDPDFNKNEFKKPVTHQVPYLPPNTNFVKNNIGADHETRFEVPEAPSYFPSENHYLRTPYAHHFQ